MLYKGVSCYLLSAHRLELCFVNRLFATLKEGSRHFTGHAWKYLVALSIYFNYAKLLKVYRCVNKNGVLDVGPRRRKRRGFPALPDADCPHMWLHTLWEAHVSAEGFNGCGPQLYLVLSFPAVSLPLTMCAFACVYVSHESWAHVVFPVVKVVSHGASFSEYTRARCTSMRMSSAFCRRANDDDLAFDLPFEHS